MTEITPEHREALTHLDFTAQMGANAAAWALLRPLLPQELLLPSEVGTAWTDKDGDLWFVGNDHTLVCPRHPGADPLKYAPFTPESANTHPITLEQIETALQVARLVAEDPTQSFATTVYNALTKGQNK